MGRRKDRILSPLASEMGIIGGGVRTDQIRRLPRLAEHLKLHLR